MYKWCSLLGGFCCKPVDTLLKNIWGQLNVLVYTLQYCTTYMHTVDIYVSELQNLLRLNPNYFAGSKTLKKPSEKSQNIKVLSFFKVLDLYLN